MVKNLVVTTTGLIVLKTTTAITSESTLTTIIIIIDSIAIAIEKMRTLTKRVIITLCLEWILD